jgi:hypothetical protein
MTEAPHNRRHDDRPGPAPGIIDPTKNVLDLVRGEIRRVDDLRAADLLLANERARYDDRLRLAESARIDAIRAVDVGAVQQAATVSATAANTLVLQVATSAETLRNQVAATAIAAATSLAAALEPLQKDIADLRRAQYEAQGVKANVGETRLNIGAVLGGFSVLLVLIFGIATLAISLAR